jgi:hypothetical protein
LWNIIPRKIFGKERDEATGGWRKTLHNLYYSPNITIKAITSRRMR